MLYNKYRPRHVDELLGNESIKTKLKSWEFEKSVPHTIMLSGPVGTGKTSTVRMIADYLIPDCYLEFVTASSENGVGKAREIASRVSQIPIGYSNKIIHLCEAHRGTGNFFDALLPSLEDTPGNVYFVIDTSEPSKIPAAVKSRCLKLTTTLPTFAEMRKTLKGIADKEGFEVDREVLSSICKTYDNAPRDCISGLESVAGLDKEHALLELSVSKDIEEESVEHKIVMAMMYNKGFDSIREILKPIKNAEVETMRIKMCNYLNGWILKEKSAEKVQKISLILDSLSNPFSFPEKTGFILSCIENT